MSNPTVILNGDEVYLDELIRENARLTVQVEAERQRWQQLRQENEALSQRAEQAEEDLSLAADSAKREAVLAAKLNQAVNDLHFVMGGGEPCKVCKRKCTMGTACDPRWQGLDG